MAERITVHFDAKGDQRLIKAINSLARAQGRLSKSTAVATGGMMRNSRASKKAGKGVMALGGTLSVVRSKLLVYAFASQLVNKTIGASIRAAMKQEDAEKRLEHQFGKSTIALQEYASELQSKTAHGDEDIMSVMGQLAAFTKNEDQVKELTKATLNLSEGMGIGLKEAGMLVGKTFGSTTNSLSRYGIQVEGAMGSSKRFEKITGNIEKRYGGMAANIDTTSKAMAQMKNSFGDAAESIGDLFMPALKSMALGTKKWVEDSLKPTLKEINDIDFGATMQNLKENSEVVQNFLARVVAVLPSIAKIAFWELVATVKSALMAIKDHVTTVFENFPGFVSLIFQHMFWGIVKTVKTGLHNMGESIRQGINDKIIEPFNDLVKKAPKIAKKLGIEEIKPFAETKVDTSELDKKLGKIQGKLDKNPIFKLLMDASKTDLQTMEEVLDELGIAWDETIGTLIVKKKALDTVITGTKDEEPFFSDENKEKMKAMAEEWGQYHNAIMGVANAYEEMQMSSIKATLQEELAAANTIRSTRRREKAIKKANEKAHKEEMKLKKDMQVIRIAEAISNTALGITKALVNPGGPPGIVLAALVGITGAMQLATIKAQKFQRGGLVGGNLHSQGGSMIEAERGEFVMSRNAVEAVGVETMNQVNSGAVGSSLNVSFAGNVMSDDFIESEAIPKIKEAIRRGADIGVS